MFYYYYLWFLMVFVSSQNEKCIWSNPSFDYVYGAFKNATLVCIIENLPLFYHQVPDTCPLTNFLEMKVDCSPQYSSSVNGFLVGAYMYLWWRLLKISVLIGNIYTRYQDFRQWGWTISLTLWEKHMSAIEKSQEERRSSWWKFFIESMDIVHFIISFCIMDAGDVVI